MAAMTLMLRRSDLRQSTPQQIAIISLVIWEALAITSIVRTISRIRSARVDICTLQPTCLQRSKRCRLQWYVSRDPELLFSLHTILQLVHGGACRMWSREQQLTS